MARQDVLPSPPQGGDGGSAGRDGHHTGRGCRSGCRYLSLSVRGRAPSRAACPAGRHPRHARSRTRTTSRVSGAARSPARLASRASPIRNRRRHSLAEVTLTAGAVWIASLLLLPLMAAPLVTHSKAGRLSLPARFALATGCGAVVLSFVMTVWALAGWRWNLTVLAATGFALCAFLRRSLPDWGPSAWRRGRRSLLERASILVLILSVAASLVATASGSASSAD